MIRPSLVEMEAYRKDESLRLLPVMKEIFFRFHYSHYRIVHFEKYFAKCLFTGVHGGQRKMGEIYLSGL